MYNAFPLVDFTFHWVPSFVLAFARISAMMFMFPYFGHASVSHRVRVLFTLVLTLFIMPVIGQVEIDMDINAIQLMGYLIKEIAIGLFIGFGGLFVFEIFTLAGTLAGRQIGLALAQMLDPAHLSRSSLVGQFWSMSMMIGFISLGFHHFLIKTIINNFQYIPLATGDFSYTIGEMYVQAGSDLFYTAFQLAAPAIVFMMMVDTAIALMARIQPTLPIFLIVLPIKILLGLFILTISIEIFQTLAVPLMENSKNLILGIISQIALNMAQNTSQEKTEQPTAKRRIDARNEGQVVKSVELNSVILMIGAVLTLYYLCLELIDDITGFTIQIYRSSSNTLLTPNSIISLTESGLLFIFDMVAPILLILLILGLLVNILQVGVSFSIKPIMPKLSKISILKGIKRLFSPKSLVELIKSIIKMSIVGIICYYIIKSHLSDYVLLPHMPALEILNFVGYNMFKIFILVSIAMIFPAIADFAYNKYEHEKNLKMTKEEVKEESKQTEGNPKVKSKIRSLQMQASRRRMMQAIPDATVVVTNPTHIAIAIKYELGWEGKAPLVLAKGQRKTAQRIKEIARKNGIPIIEDKPLARALYSIVEIGMEIPNLFFQAVAEILAKVFQNQKKVS